MIDYDGFFISLFVKVTDKEKVKCNLLCLTACLVFSLWNSVFGGFHVIALWISFLPSVYQTVELLYDN